MFDVFGWIGSHGEQVLALAAAGVTALVGKAIGQKTKSTKAGELLGRVAREVVDNVATVGRTYVKAIREASKDGKLTPAEKSTAKAMAIAGAKKSLGPAGLKKLAATLGRDVDLDHWLSTKIESYLAGALTR